jgi:4-amino-4-deoxy-L-arabinose transferase-like glycosyltransferase
VASRSSRNGTIRNSKFAPWVLAVLALLLFLGNLGNMYLWQDEAETALLSQRLGEYGLPLAFDGRNLIRQAPKDVQYTEDYVWVYHPWLPFFFTAASMRLVGATTFAARLPYALAGWATVMLLYLSVRRHFHDRRLAVLSAVLLLGCVPFLLHARQCKYFAFAALFTVATLDAYLLLQREPQPSVAMPYFVASGFCLFQSNFGAFVPLMAGLGAHFFLRRPTWRQIGTMAAAVAAVAAMILPWAIYLQTWARGRFAFDVYRFAGHLAHYLVYITGWVFPAPLAVLFAVLLIGWRRCMERSQFSAVVLFIIVIATTVLFLAETFIWMYFSYIVQLVPLLAVLLALTLLWIMERSRIVAYGLLAVLLLTNALHIFPYVVPIVRQFKWASLAPRDYLADTDALIETAGQLRSDLGGYLYELTHDYDGPDEGIALYLEQNAQPGDMVLMNYGELPVAFYTGLDIAGGLSGYRLEQMANPRWIINRRDGPYRDEMERILAQGRYEAIEIPYADILWGNRPVPEYHKYATVRDVPNVVIHRRVD